MICAACNAELREGAARCPGCGAKPGAPPPEERVGSRRLKAEDEAYPPTTRPRATVWHVTTDRPHTVELELSMLTGRETVVVDGKELVSKLKWSFRSEHVVPLGTTKGTLTVAVGGLGLPSVSLMVDGRQVPPIGTAAMVQAAGSAPSWSSGFGAACMVIPVVTLGGAIPVVLGLGAASACTAIAKNDKLPLGLRVGLCALVTLLAWGLLGVLLILVASAQRR